MELPCLGSFSGFSFSACVCLVSCGAGVLCAVGHSTVLTADSRSTEKPWAHLRCASSALVSHALWHILTHSHFLSSSSHTLSQSSSVSPSPGLEPAHLHTFSGRSCGCVVVRVISRPRGSAGGLLVTVWTGPEVAPQPVGTISSDPHKEEGCTYGLVLQANYKPWAQHISLGSRRSRKGIAVLQSIPATDHIFNFSLCD